MLGHVVEAGWLASFLNKGVTSYPMLFRLINSPSLFSFFLISFSRVLRERVVVPSSSLSSACGSRHPYQVVNQSCKSSFGRSSRRYPLLKLQRKRGPSSKQPMKERRLSRIQSFRGLLQALKKSRWRRMSHSMSSMPSSRT